MLRRYALGYVKDMAVYLPFAYYKDAETPSMGPLGQRDRRVLSFRLVLNSSKIKY